MKTLTERQFEILSFLINKEKPVSAKNLAKKFGVSTRTVRYDLDDIEYFLKGSTVKLQKRNKVGIWIDSPKEAKKMFLLEAPREEKTLWKVVSKEDRKKGIIETLLKCEGYTTISELSNILEVSYSTVRKDLNEADKWFEQREIKIIRKKKHGICISGNESNVRKAISEVLEYRNLEDAEFKIFDEWLFSDVSINVLYNYINKVSKELKVIYSDEFSTKLLIHIGICIKRLRQGKKINVKKEDIDVLKDTKEFIAVKKYIPDIEMYLGFRVPIGEIWYITTHVICTKIIETYRDKNNASLYTKEELEITQRYISKISDALSLNLRKDNILIKNLLMHIKPTLNRLKYKMPIENPILEEIKRCYPKIFGLVKKISNEISEEKGIIINDDEIGFIVMHICASVERVQKNMNKKKFRILVVCGGSIGTSKLLSSRLNSEFEELEISYEIPVSQISSYINGNIDFLISTVPIDEVLIKPVITVSPLLPEEDIVRIKSLMKVLRGEKIKTENQTVDEIMFIINQFCNVENTHELKNALEKSFDEKSNYYKNIEEQKLLTEMIDLKRIEVKVKCSDKYEAIRKVGSMLLKEGYIEEPYIDAMIKLCEELNSYIVIAPKVAMPHAKPESGAKKTGFSIIALKEPIVFGHKKNDPVSLVIGFSAINNTGHIKAMRELLSMLCEKETIEKVINSTSKEELYKNIQQFEKVYLQ